MNLHISAICCDYVNNFDVDKMAPLWSTLVEHAFTLSIDLEAADIFKLLEVAKELKRCHPDVRTAERRAYGSYGTKM